MSLEEIYYVGQTVAVVAILVTLVYVAVQTRQSTAATQAATRQALLDADQKLLTYLLDYPELEEIRYKKNLTDREKAQLAYFFYSVCPYKRKQLAAVQDRRLV